MMRMIIKPASELVSEKCFIRRFKKRERNETRRACKRWLTGWMDGWLARFKEKRRKNTHLIFAVQEAFRLDKAALLKVVLKLKLFPIRLDPSFGEASKRRLKKETKISGPVFHVLLTFSAEETRNECDRFKHVAQERHLENEPAE